MPGMVTALSDALRELGRPFIPRPTPPEAAAARTRVLSAYGDLDLITDFLDEQGAQQAGEAVAYGTIRQTQLPNGRVVLSVPLRGLLTAGTELVAGYHDLASAQDLGEWELLASFADQAALAFDRVKILELQGQLAVSKDRDQEARALHDVVIQQLFATGLELQAATAGSGSGGAQLQRSVESLNATIEDIRQTIFTTTLNPTARDSVRAVVRDYAPRLGFTPMLRTFGSVEGAVSRELIAELLEVLEQALHRIEASQDATHAVIELTMERGRVSLTVTDDGWRDPAVAEIPIRVHQGHCAETALMPRGASLTWTGAL